MDYIIQFSNFIALSDPRCGLCSQNPHKPTWEIQSMPYEGVEYRRATVGDCVTPLADYTRVALSLLLHRNPRDPLMVTHERIVKYMQE